MIDSIQTTANEGASSPQTSATWRIREYLAVAAALVSIVFFLQVAPKLAVYGSLDLRASAHEALTAMRFRLARLLLIGGNVAACLTGVLAWRADRLSPWARWTCVIPSVLYTIQGAVLHYSQGSE